MIFKYIGSVRGDVDSSVLLLLVDLVESLHHLPLPPIILHYNITLPLYNIRVIFYIIAGIFLLNGVFIK